MSGCETMVCQTKQKVAETSPRRCRQEDAGADIPTTLQPEDPGVIPVSTCIGQLNLYQEDKEGRSIHKMAAKSVGCGKVQGITAPLKLLGYICAALAFGMAVEFGSEKAWEQNTCSALSQERSDLSEKVDVLSDELADRMFQMSSLLAKETSENSRLREELEHTKRMLKYYQGAAKVPDNMGLPQGHSVYQPVDSRTWVQETFDDGVYKVWQMRYLMSEALRFVRTQLPADLSVAQTLHDWEDAIVGPVE